MLKNHTIIRYVSSNLLHRPVPGEEYVISIAFNAIGMVAVLAFFSDSLPVLAVAAFCLAVDIYLYIDYLHEKKSLTGDALALRLGHLYFPFEMVTSGIILHFLLPNLLFPTQALWAVIILFYNSFRIRSQLLTVYISALTAAALVYTLLLPQGNIEKFIALFAGLGIAVIAEIQRRIIRDIVADNNDPIEKVKDTFDSEIESTQREIIFKLSEIAECRSRETGNHVRRVAEYTRVLALGAGLPAEEVELLATVTPMHDIGKLGIPESILAKPGSLTDRERKFMQEHPLIGHNMLKSSDHKVFRAAAVVSLEHHERYDGTGYPHGKKGEDIHLYGRITAIADVFDALSSNRCYKKAWEMHRVLALLDSEAGKHFDPRLTSIFFVNLDNIRKIHTTFADAS